MGRQVGASGNSSNSQFFNQVLFPSAYGCRLIAGLRDKATSRNNFLRSNLLRKAAADLLVVTVDVRLDSKYYFPFWGTDRSETDRGSIGQGQGGSSTPGLARGQKDFNFL